MNVFTLDAERTGVEVVPFEAEGQLENVMAGEFGLFSNISKVYPIYDGATEITATSSEQVLQTENTAVLSNIIIKPIPNNYGLITWNGSVITVS